MPIFLEARTRCLDIAIAANATNTIPASNIHPNVKDEVSALPPVTGRLGAGSGVAVGSGVGLPGMLAAMTAGNTLKLPHTIRFGDTRTHEVSAFNCAAPFSFTETRPILGMFDLNTAGNGAHTIAGPSSVYESTLAPEASITEIAYFQPPKV